MCWTSWKSLIADWMRNRSGSISMIAPQTAIAGVGRPLARTSRVAQTTSVIAARLP